MKYMFMSRALLNAMAIIISLAVASPAQAQTSSDRPSRTTAAGTAKADIKADAVAHLSGWSFGAYTLAVPGISITGQDIDNTWQTGMGEGVGLLVAYTRGTTLSGYVSADIVKQQTINETYPPGSLGLAHVEVGARLNLRMSDPRTVPYLTASVGRRAFAATIVPAEADDGASHEFGLYGTMLSAGGGVQRFLTRNLALDGGVEVAYGSFDHYKEDADEQSILVNKSTSIRVRAGLTWHP